MSQSQPPPSRLSSPSRTSTGPYSVPWFTTRVVSLFLAWCCWGVIGAASGMFLFSLIFFFHRAIFLKMGLMIGINALVKSNDQKSAINKAILRPTIITIVRGIQGMYSPACNAKPTSRAASAKPASASRAGSRKPASKVYSFFTPYRSRRCSMGFGPFFLPHTDFYNATDYVLLLRLMVDLLLMLA